MEKQYPAPSHGAVVAGGKTLLLCYKTVLVFDELPLTNGHVEPSLKLTHSDIVRAVACDPTGTFIATGGDEKKLRVFQNAELVWETDVPKKISQIKLVGAPAASSDPLDAFLEQVVFADKFGCVYRAKAFYVGASPTDAVPWLKSTVMGRAGHDEVGILLGHYSTITQLLPIASNSIYLVTAEKDEKIRVSSYPETYNIVSYCLGHTKFVSALDFFEDQPLVRLISGGGDGQIMLWDLQSGAKLATLALSSVVDHEQMCSLSVLGKLPERSICVRRIAMWKQRRVAVLVLEEYRLLVLVGVSGSSASGYSLHVLSQVPISAGLVPLDVAVASESADGCRLVVVSAVGSLDQEQSESTVSIVDLKLEGEGISTTGAGAFHISTELLSASGLTTLLSALSPTLALRKIVSESKYAFHQQKNAEKLAEHGPQQKRQRLE